MQVVKIINWEEDRAWVGHLQNCPDYRTQGETRDDLKGHRQQLLEQWNGFFGG